jgi:hypothetical protein
MRLHELLGQETMKEWRERIVKGELRGRKSWECQKGMTVKRNL